MSDVRISDDGSTVVFVRGTAPNSDGWVANPTADPNGAERAIWAARTRGGTPWKVVTDGRGGRGDARGAAATQGGDAQPAVIANIPGLARAAFKGVVAHRRNRRLDVARAPRHGDDDRNVAFQQTTGVVQLLRQRDVHYELIVFPDDTHESMLHSRWLYTLDRMDVFLKNYLSGTTKSTTESGR